MRQINYILIDETTFELRSYRSGKRRTPNLGNHYFINMHGQRLQLLNDHKVGNVADSILHLNKFDYQKYNDTSIGILYYGSLKESFGKEPSSQDSINKEILIDLLVRLRSKYPNAKILGVSEIDGKDIKPSEVMNALRSELSNMP